MDGDIASKTLVIEEGAIFQGQSIMDQQNAPAAQTQKSVPAAPEVQEAKA